MENTDRPSFSLHKAAEIEQTQNDVDRQFWEALCIFQVAIFDSDSTPRRSAPKRPAALLLTLAAYAANLFIVEGSFYPDRPQLRIWLEKLKDRIIDRIAMMLDHLERQGESRGLSLMHHEATPEEMRSSVIEELNRKIEKRLSPPQPLAVPPPPLELPGNRGPLPASAYAASGVDIASASPLLIMAMTAARSAQRANVEISLSAQIKRLQIECDISAEKMAEAVGIVPRSIYKHLAGKTVPRRGHVAAYEKLFSERLNRPVTLKRS